MTRILEHEPKGHATVVISNTHGDAPNKEICEFCGKRAIDELERKMKDKPSGRVYFEKDGCCYRLYGGLTRAVTLPGKYCFHVYKYDVEDSSGKKSSAFDSYAKGYAEFCERLFQKWLEDKQSLAEFSADFQIDYLPEPYQTVQSGRRILYVLNNNPGHGIPKQLWENIHDGKGKKHYEQEAARMAGYYWSDDFKRSEPNAASRMVKMLEFAKGIGMDGVVNVEAFFLHSPNMDKDVFLKKYSKKEIVRQYTQLLKAFLRGKPVLTIASVGTKASIDRNALKRNEWITYLSNVMGLNLDTAKIIPVTQKDGKTTSCLLVDNGKIMAISMGSNNLPRISGEIYKKIQRG